MKLLALTFSAITVLLLAAAPAVHAQCSGDVIANGVVDINGDLTAVTLNYGCTGNCVGDANGNGFVGAIDYLTVLSNLGPCPVVEDVNESGTVTILDLQFIAPNDGLNCLVDADNDTDVDEIDAFIISASVNGSPDALPMALADVNGDGILDQDDTYDTFLAEGRDCIFDVNRDGIVEGLPGGADFDQICDATGIC